jgi:hypothetical protein
MPHSLSLPIQVMSSSSPGDGESPVFVASNPAFPGFQSWCVVVSVGTLLFILIDVDWRTPSFLGFRRDQPLVVRWKDRCILVMS